jgi:hypothetical protein
MRRDAQNRLSSVKQQWQSKLQRLAMENDEGATKSLEEQQKRLF